MLILCFVNVILLLALTPSALGSFSGKVDPGLATLIGAIVGFSIVAYQARAGFMNLIRSQENQAKLEREARVHQMELDEEARKIVEVAERKTLMAALRAEL